MQIREDIKALRRWCWNISSSHGVDTAWLISSCLPSERIITDGKWKYHFIMMTSSNANILRVTGLCAENTPVTGEFPSQRPVTPSLDFFWSAVWINGWVNSREAGDLRRHGAHYDVIVMMFPQTHSAPWQELIYSFGWLPFWSDSRVASKYLKWLYNRL